MNNSLSGLSKVILAIMVVIVLVCGGVVFVIRGMEKALAPMQKAAFIPRSNVEKGAFLIHGYWVFDKLDNSDYQRENLLDSLFRAKPIQFDPKTAEPSDYKAAQYYACNYVPEHDFYYWARFKEVKDPKELKDIVNKLSRIYPYSLISSRYNRYYNDEQYDKRNRNRFYKLFGLPDPKQFEPIIVMEESHHFKNETETPGEGAELDGFTVKSVDKNRLVLTYQDSKGQKLDIVYKNESKLPLDILSYSVYFKDCR